MGRASQALAYDLEHGPAYHLLDVPDPVRGSGQHIDGSAPH
jgi:hypothetical protein